MGGVESLLIRLLPIGFGVCMSGSSWAADGPRKPETYDMQAEEADLITVPELARETGLPVSWLYERTRFDALPGQRRLGKYVRIDRNEFFAALREGKVK